MAEGKSETEFIEVIEETLDNQMFLLAVAGGVVLGLVAFYAWQEYMRTRALGNPKPSAPEPIEYIEDAKEQVTEAYSMPAWGS